MNKATLIALACAALLSACGGNPMVTEGQELIEEGRIEEGMALLESAALTAPRDAKAYATWITQRDAMVSAYVRDGNLQRQWGDLEAAEQRYRKALGLDPLSPSAQAGMETLRRDRRLLALTLEAENALARGDYDAAEKNVRAVLAENSSHRAARALMKTLAERRTYTDTTPPQLASALKKPITLEFRDAPLRSVFEVISRTVGINFVFDRDVRQDLKATIFVRNSNLEDVIKLLLVTNQLDRKVVNENSILVFPNTPAKQKEYQELVVRSFYLANADAKQTAAMIRALAKTRDLFVDEKLNLVMMKDTPDAVRLAEQLVASQDLGEPEVMLELEVLEVASSRLQELGIRYPTQVNWGELSGGGKSTTSTGAGGDTTVTTATSVPPITELHRNFGNFELWVTNPALVLNLRQTDGIVNTLANPRIRVRNRDKAKIHIGEKVPVITSTSTANVGVSSSVSYLEVGLKLDVEPNIYLEDEVAIKVQLEVSNILEELRVQSTVSYRLGTRNASTTLRLRDGETQMLAGLINDEDRRSSNKLPFLGDFPLLGRLFRSDNDNKVKTEIVLLITPHIVRNLTRPDTVRAMFPSGTDMSPGTPPLRLGTTAARSLAVSASGGGMSSGVRNLAPAAAAPAESLTMNVQAPEQARIGGEFGMAFTLPANNDGSRVALQLSFDPAQLQPASAANDKGQLTLNLEGPAVIGAPPATVQQRFRVIGRGNGTAQIGIEALSTTDAQGKPMSITIPSSVTVALVGEAPAVPSGAGLPPPPPPQAAPAPVPPGIPVQQ